MEDACVVCAEPLEWCAYGPCNHKEVCSTCVTRLRLVLEDNRCCICKQECPTVFVTKALGDYTRTVSDFRSLRYRVILGSAPSPGRDLWFNQQIQAYFDDESHFSTIDSMCKLSCRICANEGYTDPSALKFEDLNSLKRHLKIAHNLLMCELCLEGKKVFMSEQKLYNAEQLQQHKRKGNSVIDGSQEERGGFTGHPSCEFCGKHFYGENELYQHMSTEHFRCHLCQRDRPGNYEYFRNYEHLEMHFRNEHFLCENPDCLTQKFVVFKSEADFKRHNVQSHGGNMSRAERNRALQIPATQLFNFQRTRGGGEDSEASNRRLRRNPANRSRASDDDDVNVAIQNSLEISQLESAIHESMVLSSSSSPAFPPLSSSDTAVSRSAAPSQTSRVSLDPRSRARSPAHEVLNTPDHFPSLTDNPTVDGPLNLHRSYVYPSSSSLQPSSFPPLPASTPEPASKAVPGKKSKGASMAAVLGGKKSFDNQIRVIRPSNVRPNAPSLQPSSFPPLSVVTPSAPATTSSPSFPPLSNTAAATANSFKGGTSLDDASSTGGKERNGFILAASKKDKKPSTSKTSSSSPTIEVSSEFFPSLYAHSSSSSSSSSNSLTQVSSSAEEAPPVPESEADLKAETKALAQEIRKRLESDSISFSEFRNISGEFRHGTLSSIEYFEHIVRLGLSDLVPRIARTCPDPQKRLELLEAHEANAAAEDKGKRKKEKKENKDKKEKKEKKEKNVDWTEGGSFESKITEWEDAVHSEERQKYRKGKGNAERRVLDDSSFPNLSHVSLASNNFHVSASAPNLSSPSFQASSSGSSNADSAGKWACEVCTLLNPAEAMRCEACGSANKNLELDGRTEKKKKSGKKERILIGGYGRFYNPPEPTQPVGNVWLKGKPPNLI